ncbi:MAG: zinc-ribbon domain-containing protein [Methanobacteriaceae archaeon]|nr:zinc-ribbon domain-containing protein [Methanobacteriaceae archaeon]MDD4594726.1 zinc-ribbon domain-containing protein [Methanobacteriaceae archaeon]
MSDESKIQCTRCGYLNESDAKFCLNCGYKLGKNNLNKQKCPDCGYLNESDAKFCLNCGCKLNMDLSSTNINTDKSNPNSNGNDKNLHDADAKFNKENKDVNIKNNNETINNSNLNQKGESVRNIDNVNFESIKNNNVNPNQMHKPLKHKNKFLSILFAIIFIGAGAWYNKQTKRGSLYFILAAIIFFSVGVNSNMVVFLIIIYFVQIIDAYSSANEINKGKEPKLLNFINVPKGW